MSSQSSSLSNPPALLPTIKKLDLLTINKIAAGEIIHSSYNAIKELLENSIDAKSKKISIVLKEGGLKLIQIIDDGTGINKEDFPLVCERFATSKITNFKDLENIATFGFRGEALASITHIAHLNIISMIKNSQVAYKASFSDGQLICDNNGNIIEPLACAGVPGTTITIEDMFYNNEIRRKAIKNLSEEYNKCLEVIQRYSINFPHISFSCKKQGATVSDYHSQPNSTTLNNIQLTFGKSIACELLKIENTVPNYSCKFNGYISNANFNIKKLKAVEQSYANYLPKQTHPFIYLSISLDPTTLDVNVHPTKREVVFLHEDEIISALVKCVGEALISSNNSRHYDAHIQVPLTNFSSLHNNLNNEESYIKEPPSKIQNNSFFSSVITDSKQPPKSFVRTDSLNPVGQLDTYFKPQTPHLLSNTSSSLIGHNIIVPKVNTSELSSVREIIASIESDCHSGISFMDIYYHIDLREIFSDYSFIGIFNDYFALVQKDTKLYMLNICILSYSFFFELSIRSFNSHRKCMISSILITDLLKTLPIEYCNSFNPSNVNIDLLIKDIMIILVDKRELLDEYFGITITQCGNLVSLPSLIDNYIPNFIGLPLFLARLALKVNWKNEKECFRSICHEIAMLYQILPEEVWEDSKHIIDSKNQLNLTQTIQNIILPAMRYNFHPSNKHSDDGTIIKVASLEKLYKIFERC